MDELQRLKNSNRRLKRIILGVVGVVSFAVVSLYFLIADKVHKNQAARAEVINTIEVSNIEERNPDLNKNENVVDEPCPTGKDKIQRFVEKDSDGSMRLVDYSEKCIRLGDMKTAQYRYYTIQYTAIVECLEEGWYDSDFVTGNNNPSFVRRGSLLAEMDTTKLTAVSKWEKRRVTGELCFAKDPQYGFLFMGVQSCASRAAN